MVSKKQFLSTAFIIAAVSLVGCSKGMNNSNLTAQSDSTSTVKWDTFADAVGMAHLENAPDGADVAAVTAALSVPPANFQPTVVNGKVTNADQYAAVQKAVADFVINDAANMQASQIVSIVPFDSKILGADSADQGSSFVSIPYLGRDGKNYDLSRTIKTNSGIDVNGKFSVNQSVNGIVSTSIKPATGTVYLITYQLGGNTAQNYQALVSIPSDASATKQYPLMMFAHGGDAGLAFSEMATLLQGNLGKFIVAAPVYPGEPICAVTFTQGTEANGYARSCVDHSGNVTAPVVAAVGSKSPMRGDVDSLLALQNGISQLLLSPSTVYSGSNNVFLDLNNSKPIISFNSTDPTLKGIYGPQTIAIADSRGGGTLMAALGRTGMIIPEYINCKLTLAHPCAFGNKIPTPSFFSGSAFYYSPSSFLVGQFRFLTQYMMSGNVPSGFNGLPMVPEMTHYFDNYRNAQSGSATEITELTNLVGFMGASDITYLAPYISAAVQNWTTNSMSLILSQQVVPGSIIFVHGTQDAIVPFTESLIAKTAMDGVFDNIYGAGASTSPLVANLVPAVGSQIYSFQPDASYYNVKLGTAGCNNTPDATGNLPVNFNSSNNQCFGGGIDHGLDPSFLTSRLENSTLQLQNVDVTNGKASVGIQHELLYGFDPASDPNLCRPDDKSCKENPKPYTFYQQIVGINSGLDALHKYNIDEYTNDACLKTPTINGVCYAMGFMSFGIGTQSYPLYYRSIGEDKNSSTANALLGVWDTNTQKYSQLSPTDLVTSWLDVSVLDSSQGVFTTFN